MLPLLRMRFIGETKHQKRYRARMKRRPRAAPRVALRLGPVGEGPCSWCGGYESIPVKMRAEDYLVAGPCARCLRGFGLAMIAGALCEINDAHQPALWDTSAFEVSQRIADDASDDGYWIIPHSGCHSCNCCFCGSDEIVLKLRNVGWPDGPSFCEKCFKDLQHEISSALLRHTAAIDRDIQSSRS